MDAGAGVACIDVTTATGVASRCALTSELAIDNLTIFLTYTSIGYKLSSLTTPSAGANKATVMSVNFASGGPFNFLLAGSAVGSQVSETVLAGEVSASAGTAQAAAQDATGTIATSNTLAAGLLASGYVVRLMLIGDATNGFSMYADSTMGATAAATSSTPSGGGTSNTNAGGGGTSNASLQAASSIDPAPLGAAGGAVLVIVFIVVWWCVRGKWWWHSTSHKRGFCHPQSACKGFLCCHPWEANPPPHGDSKGRKSQALRVAPCFPQNPCGSCRGGEEADNDLERHPAGCGCACDCQWAPGCCCWKWPAFVLKALCQDELPGETAKEVKEKAKEKKGGLLSKFGFGKKKDAGGPAQPQRV